MTNNSILLKISEIERACGRLEGLKLPSALRPILERPIPTPPLSETWFLEAHRHFIPTGGSYRTDQVYLSDPDTGLIHYIPPAPEQIAPLMQELLSWLSDSSDHPLLFAATAHFRLVQIHPFLNGNGRLARHLTTHILTHAGYPYLHLATLARDRPGYYQALQAVRDQELNLAPWHHYFLSHLHTQLTHLHTRLLTTLAPNLDPRAQQVLGYALHATQFTLSDLEAEFPTHHCRTWQRALRTLLDRQLLQASGATNRRTYSLSSRV